MTWNIQTEIVSLCSLNYTRTCAPMRIRHCRGRYWEEFPWNLSLPSLHHCSKVMECIPYRKHTYRKTYKNAGTASLCSNPVLTEKCGESCLVPKTPCSLTHKMLRTVLHSNLRYSPGESVTRSKTPVLPSGTHSSLWGTSYPQNL